MTKRWCVRARHTALGCAALLFWCASQASRAPAQEPASTDAPVEWSASERARVLTLAPLPPVPDDLTNPVADSLAAARLGRALFFDAGLSRTGTVSCATCHDPELAFADGRPTGRGLADLTRNTPSLLGAAWQRWYFWDGRADSLWSQALQPIEHPDEMGSTRLQVLRHVAGKETLRAEYVALFGPLPALEDQARFPPQARAVPAQVGDAQHQLWRDMAEADRLAVDRAFSNLGKALAAYQRKLVGGPAPFDQFVEGLRQGTLGNPAPISLAAQRGLKLFVGKADCRSCHNGPTFSDGEFHDVGLPVASSGARRDSGRFEGIQKLRADPFNAAGIFSSAPKGERASDIDYLDSGGETWGLFKTPSLRNVARTAPYMHAGQFLALDQVLHFYSTREGARPAGHHGETVLEALFLTPQELLDLRAFLESLSQPDPPAEWCRVPDAAGQ